MKYTKPKPVKTAKVKKSATVRKSSAASGSSLSKIRRSLFGSRRQTGMLLFAVGFGAIGVYLLTQSYAQTTIPRYVMKQYYNSAGSPKVGITIDLDQAQLSGPARLVDDYQAHNGKAVVFDSAGMSADMIRTQQENIRYGWKLQEMPKQWGSATFIVERPASLSTGATDTGVYLRYKQKSANSAMGQIYLRINDDANRSFIGEARLSAAEKEASAYKWTLAAMSAHPYNTEMTSFFKTADSVNADGSYNYKVTKYAEIGLDRNAGVYKVQLYGPGLSSLEVDSIIIGSNGYSPDNSDYAQPITTATAPSSPTSTNSTTPPVVASQPNGAQQLPTTAAPGTELVPTEQQAISQQEQSESAKELTQKIEEATKNATPKKKALILRLIDAFIGLFR